MLKRIVKALAAQGASLFSPTALVIGLLVLALFLRVINISSHSLWYDEAQVVVLSRLPFTTMFWGLLSLDPHPPLHYAQLKLWNLPGEHEVWIRLNSVFWGGLGVLLVFAFAKKHFGWKAAGLAGFLVAISPFHLWYSQEVRMYALSFFAAGALMWVAYNFFFNAVLKRWQKFSLPLLTAAVLGLHSGYFLALAGL